MNPETYLPPEKKPSPSEFDMSGVDFSNLQPTANTAYILNGFKDGAMQAGKFSGIETLNPAAVLELSGKYNLESILEESKLANSPLENIVAHDNKLSEYKKFYKGLQSNKISDTTPANPKLEPDLWTYPVPKTQIALPPLDGSPAQDDTDYSDLPDWFAHDPELGETTVTSLSETEAIKEKTTKAQKIGEFVMKAVSGLAGASLLAPGTALQYAKQPTEQPQKEAANAKYASAAFEGEDDWLNYADVGEPTSEPAPDKQPDTTDGPTGSAADWLKATNEALLADKVEPVVEAEKHEQWTGAFEQKGYIKEAPRFSEQVQDTSRTNRFRYVLSAHASSSYSGGSESAELTEHEGLVGLQQFLKEYIEKSSSNISYSPSYGDPAKLRLIAQGILENLTFIGDKEYVEAVKGLGDYWKAFLDEDPQRQVCVLTRVSRTYGARKSDVYLSERILETFTDEELERYGGRIITELEDITAEPKDLKLVMLDDWTISGTQLGAAYESIHQNVGKKYDGSLEVNLLTATPNRVANGMTLGNYSIKSPVVPVRAYYQSHSASEAANGAHISGTHSSVDFDFETQIRNMVLHLEQVAMQAGESYDSVVMPPLTNIIRAYRYTEPAVVVERNRITKRRKGDNMPNSPPDNIKTSNEEEEEEEEQEGW